MTPKNDKARKAWLAGLKTGDIISWVSDRRRELGPVRVQRDGLWCDGKFFTAKTGKGADGRWLMPLTDEDKEEYREALKVRRVRQRFQCIGYLGWQNEFTSAQILAAGAILWPESAS